MTPRIVVMAESAIDGVTLSERFDASDLDSEYLRARLFEPPVVGGWRCPSGRASWRRGVRCRRAQSRGRYEAIQPGRSRDGPVDDLRDRVEMIQKTQGALGRRGWREPPVEGRGAGFPSRGPQLACRRQPRRSQSWHCDHADSAGRMTARRRNQSSRRGRRGCPAQARRRSWRLLSHRISSKHGRVAVHRHADPRTDVTVFDQQSHGQKRRSLACHTRLRRRQAVEPQAFPGRAAVWVPATARLLVLLEAGL